MILLRFSFKETVNERESHLAERGSDKAALRKPTQTRGSKVERIPCEI